MFEKTSNNEFTSRSNEEQKNIEYLKKFHLKHVPKYGVDWNVLSLVTLERQTLSRILYYDKLYKKIIKVPGVICEFGVQWGGTLAQLIALRGLYEPYNHKRYIYGFDTFEGFVNTSKKFDGKELSDGDYSVYSGYEKELEKILNIHESNSPISHIKKFKLIKGDASKTSRTWAKENPHTIVSMAIFDMDIYKPTKDALEIIIPKLTKGSLLVFDQLNHPDFPGEAKALTEILSLNDLKLEQFHHQPNSAWCVWGNN